MATILMRVPAGLTGTVQGQFGTYAIANGQVTADVRDRAALEGDGFVVVSEVGGLISASGAYTVVTADDTAGTKTIPTGLASVTTMVAQIRRAGVDVSADAVVTRSGGSIVVADGAVTYALTAGDIVHWRASGTTS